MKYLKFIEDYSDRSLELINYQKDVVNLINDSNDLNTTEFIEKSREDEKRFNSLDSIKNYHALLIKNEFINILLSNEDFENSKSKLLKRLKNRVKSLKRIKSDDIFSCIQIQLPLFMILIQIIYLQNLKRTLR